MAASLPRSLALQAVTVHSAKAERDAYKLSAQEAQERAKVSTLTLWAHTPASTHSWC